MATTREKAPTRKMTPVRRRRPAAPKPEVFQLRLYVAGQTPKSTRAVNNLRAICEERLKGRYRIEVIDLLEHPHMARGNQIVAVPTLVVQLPEEVRQVIGDLSSADRVLVGLGLQPVG
jgi:circadian clock protein KaiB